MLQNIRSRKIAAVTSGSRILGDTTSSPRSDQRVTSRTLVAFLLPKYVLPVTVANKLEHQKRHGHQERQGHRERPSQPDESRWKKDGTWKSPTLSPQKIALTLPGRANGEDWILPECMQTPCLLHTLRTRTNKTESPTSSYAAPIMHPMRRRWPP